MSTPNISNLTSVDLFQNGSVAVHYKQTSEPVLDYWDQQMAAINTLINLTGTPGNSASSQITGVQATAMQTAINNLITMANNGLTTGTPPNEKTDFITVEMARDLDNLLRTIEGADTGGQFTLGSVTLPLTTVQAWRDFAEASPVIRQIVQHMNSARAVGGVWSVDGGYLDGVVDSAGRLQVGSLQSMIELLYVKTGNELMADNLEKLESALTTNKAALESLTALQNLHNEITAFSKGQQPFDTGALFPSTGTAPLDTAARTEFADRVKDFYDSVIPELGPGMASAFDIMAGYEIAGDKLANTSFSSQWPFVLNNLINAITQLGSAATWTDANRAQLVSTIKNYRDAAVPYNAAVTKLNALMAPYLEQLGLPPDASLPIPMGFTTPPTVVSFPIKFLPPLPDFAADDIPFAETTTGPAELTGTRQASLNFRDEFLTPFRNAFGAVFSAKPTFPITEMKPFFLLGANSAQVAGALYEIPEINSGNQTLGLGPVANIAFSDDIQKQFQILQDQIAVLANDPNQTSSPNSLYSTLKKVVADMTKAGIDLLPPMGAFAGLDATGKNLAIDQITAFANKWVIDGLGDKNSSFSGKIQENLDTAIAAGESLNDQQKEETRRFLFLFEEFYKSASAILTKITELIQKMAQNINK